MRRLAIMFLLVFACSEETPVAPEVEQTVASCDASLGAPQLSGDIVSVPVVLGAGVELMGAEYAWAIFRPLDGACTATPALVVYPASWDGSTLAWSVDRSSFLPLVLNQFRMEITVGISCAEAGFTTISTACAATQF